MKIGCLAFSVIIASEIFKAIKRFLRKEELVNVGKGYTKAD
jgi:hypothetical protein